MLEVIFSKKHPLNLDSAVDRLEDVLTCWWISMFYW